MVSSKLREYDLYPFPLRIDNTKTHTTDVEVLDAQRLEDPSFCVAHVPWHMGASFHGTFTRETYLAPPTGV